MIYLTSFKKFHQLPSSVKIWSAAVYQPKGLTLPKADWTDIRDDEGQWIRPRLFLAEDKPLQAYRQRLLDLYENRILQANAWRSGLTGDNALCCWCPYDQAAERQLEEWGSFVCHTAVLGEFLAAIGEAVWYDSDRLRLAVLSQK